MGLLFDSPTLQLTYSSTGLLVMQWWVAIND